MRLSVRHGNILRRYSVTLMTTTENKPMAPGAKTTGAVAVNWQQHILREIANPHCTRREVAHTYAILLSLRQEGHTVDFQPIADAILQRWSMYALDWIVKHAWARLRKHGAPCR